MDREQNEKRFEQLMGKVNREGKDTLLTYLREKTDYFSAPASTKFHSSVEGGLLQHSLNVYDCLVAKKDSPVWKNIIGAIPEESLIIMALFHDLCKINCYTKGTKNQKTYDKEKVAAEKAANPKQVKHDDKGDFVWETVDVYEFNDSMPLGHGEKSVMLLNCFIKLNTQELFAIRWHMGFSEEKSQYSAVGNAMEKFPVVLALNEADMEATKILEKEL